MKKKDKNHRKTTEKQEAFIREKLKGKSDRRAALDAGYAPSVAHHADREIVPRVEASLREALERVGLRREKLARRLAEGVDAKEIRFFAKDGIVTDQRVVPDLGMRHTYLQTVLKLQGELIEKHQVSVNLSLGELIQKSLKSEEELDRETIQIEATEVADAVPESGT